MQEEWVRWQPISNAAPKYNVIEVCQRSDTGLIIDLQADGSNSCDLKIVFSENVYALRTTDEILRTSMISNLVEKYGSRILGDWTFYYVHNSLYLQWLSEQSSGLSDYRRLTHFCVLGSDIIVDVVANYEPTVLLVDNAELQK